MSAVSQRTASPGTAFEGTDPFTPQARHLAVVSGGLGDPSQTRMLADALAEATSEAMSATGVVPEVHLITLRELATDIAQALVAGARSPDLDDAVRQVEQADAVIAVSPTFKASYAGLFKSFIDLIEDGTLTGVPVLLGATGGTARHSLMIDTALRPLFAYLKAVPVATGVFAASDDWGSVDGKDDSTRTTPLRRRIAAAGADLAAAVLARPTRPRTSDGADDDLEVIPFEQLLNRGR